MSGAPRKVSPVWKTCGEPRSCIVNGSSENMDRSDTDDAPVRRRADAMNQFCDSMASKSVNARR